MKKLFLKLFVLGSACCSLLATEVKVCFTPSMDCRDKILSAINKAETEILIQSYMFTDAEIAEALIKAHKRNVNVLVIYDKRYLGKTADKIGALKQAGINTFADAIAGIAHSKVMVIDRQTTLTGSYNFTEAAQERNVENLVLIEDEDVANQFARQWFTRYTVQEEKIEKDKKKEAASEEEKEQGKRKMTKKKEIEKPKRVLRSNIQH